MSVLIPDHLTNPDGLMNWKSKISDLNINKNKILTLNFIGDSITAGTGAAKNSGIDEFLPIDLQTLFNQSYVGIIRNYFNAKYENCGGGFIGPYWHDPSTIQYMTFSNGWVQSGYPQDYNQGIMESWITQTPNATISFSFVGTGIRIFYQQGNYIARNQNDGTTLYISAGTFTTSIDNGVEISHDMSGNDDGGHFVDITGLDDEKHTITIKYTGTSEQAMVFQGIQELTPATYGINTNNIGRAGAAAWYFGLDNILNNTIDSFKTDLTCVELGLNDYLNEFYTTQNFERNFERLIEKIKKSGSECLILIVSQPRVEINYIPEWSEYVETEYKIAEKYNCAVLDLTKRFKQRDFLILDKIHPTPIGHKDYAQAILKIIK